MRLVGDDPDLVRPDLVGTVDAVWPEDHTALFRRAGLDDSWFVVAVELDGRDGVCEAALLAVPMPPAGHFAAWLEQVEGPGRSLQVRRFPVPAGGALPADLGGGLGVLAAFRRWSLRMVAEQLQDVPLVVLVDG